MDQATYFSQMREKRKADILTNARKILLKEGISSFNMQKLAKSLDISTVTLYKYFKNTEDVFASVSSEIIRQTIGRTERENQKLNDLDITSLEHFLSLYRVFFNEALKSQKDLTLLVLIQAYTQNSSADVNQQEKLSTCADTITAQAKQLLLDAQSNNELKNDIDVESSFKFIQNITLSTLQHIGLMSSKEFSIQKQELQNHIDEIISMFKVYLTLDVN